MLEGSLIGLMLDTKMILLSEASNVAELTTASGIVPNLLAPGDIGLLLMTTVVGVTDLQEGLLGELGVIK